MGKVLLSVFSTIIIRTGQKWGQIFMKLRMSRGKVFENEGNRGRRKNCGKRKKDGNFCHPSVQLENQSTKRLKNKELH